MDCSLPGSSAHGILQARMLERVAISFSRDLPEPGMEPISPAWQAGSLPLSHLGSYIDNLYKLSMYALITYTCMH